MPAVADETVVADATVIVAALADAGKVGAWAQRSLVGVTLAAPHVMPVEAGSALRRHVSDGRLSVESATLAHGSLAAMSFEYFAYEPFATRIWQLRDTVSPYDAWYVALAEILDVPMLTLDLRLTRASGPRCKFRVPPSEDIIQTGME